MRDRRQFLKILTGAAAASALGPACGTNEGVAEAKGPVPAGNIRDLPVGALTAVSGEPVAIARDKRGVYALSTVCTHRQCNMENDGNVSEKGLSCGCHGSQFDRDGAVVNGPALSPLRHYRVTLNPDGSLVIDAGDEVAPEVRVPVA